MKKIVISIFILFNIFCTGQIPSIQWSKNFGGGGSDRCSMIIQGRDGSFYCIGTSISGTGQVTDHRGSLSESDVWITKFNQYGDFIWGKSYGGLYTEKGISIMETFDMGLIFIGTTQSDQLDVSGLHGASGAPWGYEDIWLVKTDSFGIIEWQKCIGSNDIDEGVKVMQDSDSGYVLLGNIDMIGGDITQTFGDFDFWFAKLNSSGDFQWRKTLGSSSFDTPHGFTIMNDGSYLITGGSGGSGGNFNCVNADKGVWVVRLDTTGNIIWQNCYGGSNYDNGFDIKESNDGGFYIAATTMSNDGDVSATFGYYDFWIIKCDSLGNILWEKCFGGPDFEYISSIAATNDGGAIACGYTQGVLPGSHGLEEAFVVKLDEMGTTEWEKCFGGSYHDRANSILQLEDSSFIFAGSSNSWDGDITNTHGTYDYWVVKLNSSLVDVNEIDRYYSNLHGTIIHNSLKINFESRTSEHVVISLTDLLGRMIFNAKIQSHVGVNEYSFPINISNGISILKLSSDKGVISKKVF